jgi:pimeloyl-ACP methyl ester carboxylesterase
MPGAGMSLAEPERPADGCPPPLQWHDVLEQFRRQRTIQNVSVGGVRLRGAVWGTGEPVVFSPGFLGDHEQFVLSAHLLREHFQCILLDPPMLERFPVRSPEQCLCDWAAAVRTIVEQAARGTCRVHAAGFSGLMLIQLLTDTPRSVFAASLQCAFTRWRPTLAERAITAAGIRSRRRMDQVGQAMKIQQRNHRRWFPPFDHTRWDFYRSNIGATEIRQASLRAKLAASLDLTPALCQIRQPVLIIETEGDGRVTTAAQGDLSASLTNSQTVSFDNCGRLPQVTHPHRLAKLLREFWETA